VVSGFSTPDVIITTLRLSVADYLVKPVKPGELFVSVERAFSAFLNRLQGERLSPAWHSLDQEPSGEEHASSGTLSDDSHTKLVPFANKRSKATRFPDTHSQSIQFLIEMNAIRCRQAAAYGIDDLQTQMLIDLAWCTAQNKPVSITGLISGLNIAMATGYRRLRELEEKQLLERCQLVSDKRLIYIRLTEKGRQFVEAVHKSCVLKFPDLY
jgi:DNA-binding MarR family transcriptional regulator